ncbi:hypothetical protein EVAR_81790_1 [Eumeta japonica]|uniref:Uncharacterized protein n=1 Tax=Eumeta variegata TaxID=151549 RepID=A0A4C1UHL5_EUMVA|nr:hypothetical protein EVAR_81790_1 [Eumeta japonica]
MGPNSETTAEPEWKPKQDRRGTMLDDEIASTGLRALKNNLAPPRFKLGPALYIYKFANPIIVLPARAQAPILSLIQTHLSAFTCQLARDLNPDHIADTRFDHPIRSRNCGIRHGHIYRSGCISVDVF